MNMHNKDRLTVKGLYNMLREDIRRGRGQYAIVVLDEQDTEFYAAKNSVFGWDCDQTFNLQPGDYHTDD